MESNELKKFLKSIGFEKQPMTGEEIQAFTAKVIENLPESQTHEFTVHADKSKHVPAKTTREMTWEEKEAARIDRVNKSNQQLRQLMQEIGVTKSDIDDGYFDFTTTLTSQQAIALQESNLIQGLSAKHPALITMI